MQHEVARVVAVAARAAATASGSPAQEKALYILLSVGVCVCNLVPIAAKVICSAFSRQLSLGSVSLRPIARSGFSVKRVQIKFEETPLTISAILKPNNSRF